VKFYGLLRAGYASIGYRYSTLCQLLPLTRQKYLSKARQILDPAHEELMRTEFVAAVEWSDAEGEGDEERDWLVTYVPGGRAIAEVERYRLSSWAGLEEQEEVETLSLPFEVDEGREAEIEALVEEILRVTGDEESRAFYQRVARLCPTDLLYRVLSEVKDEWRRGLIRTTKGAVFTDKLKRLCREWGIELGLRET
jgi:hypothetical protein